MCRQYMVINILFYMKCFFIFSLPSSDFFCNDKRGRSKWLSELKMAHTKKIISAVCFGLLYVMAGVINYFAKMYKSEFNAHGVNDAVTVEERERIQSINEIFAEIKESFDMYDNEIVTEYDETIISHTFHSEYEKPGTDRVSHSIRTYLQNTSSYSSTLTTPTTVQQPPSDSRGNNNFDVDSRTEKIYFRMLTTGSDVSIIKDNIALPTDSVKITSGSRDEIRSSDLSTTTASNGSRGAENTTVTADGNSTTKANLDGTEDILRMATPHTGVNDDQIDNQKQHDYTFSLDTVSTRVRTTVVSPTPENVNRSIQQHHQSSTPSGFNNHTEFTEFTAHHTVSTGIQTTIVSITLENVNRSTEQHQLSSHSALSSTQQQQHPSSTQSVPSDQSISHAKPTGSTEHHTVLTVVQITSTPKDIPNHSISHESTDDEHHHKISTVSTPTDANQSRTATQPSDQSTLHAKSTESTTEEHNTVSTGTTTLKDADFQSTRSVPNDYSHANTTESTHRTVSTFTQSVGNSHTEATESTEHRTTFTVGHSHATSTNVQTTANASSVTTVEQTTIVSPNSDENRERSFAFISNLTQDEKRQIDIKVVNTWFEVNNKCLLTALRRLGIVVDQTLDYWKPAILVLSVSLDIKTKPEMDWITSLKISSNSSDTARFSRFKFSNETILVFHDYTPYIDNSENILYDPKNLLDKPYPCEWKVCHCKFGVDKQKYSKINYVRILVPK